MTVLQLPTAYFIPKVGYKGFVLFGWTVRASLLFILAILPLLRFLPAMVQVELMLTCLFLFNVVRGISTGAWLPWLTALVPANARGAFLRSDQLHMQCGGMLAVAISTIVLWSGGRSWQFSLLFAISGLAGMLKPSLCAQDSGYRDRRTSQVLGSASSVVGNPETSPVHQVADFQLWSTTGSSVGWPRLSSPFSKGGPDTLQGKFSPSVWLRRLERSRAFRSSAWFWSGPGASRFSAWP